MNKITINGKTHNVQGNNIIIRGDSIKVDDQVVEGNLSGEITVKFEGDIANLDCHNANIDGDVNANLDCHNANVKGNVNGDVDCLNLNCHDVKGDVDCTTLKCNNITGNVQATQINMNTLN